MYNVGGMKKLQISLKPQDVMILLKLVNCGYTKRPPYSEIAESLSMSQSEVNAAVRRLQAAGLLHGKEFNERPISEAVAEFLIHGVKYMFPPVMGSISRGMPTSYAAEPLNKMINQGDDPIPVWPDANGSKKGIALYPFYNTAPRAAERDPELYESLALVDAIRSGRARERNLAEKELLKRLKKNN